MRKHLALFCTIVPGHADCENCREYEQHGGDGCGAGQGEGGVLRIGGGGGPRQAEGDGHAEHGWKKRSAKHFCFRYSKDYLM